MRPMPDKLEPITKNDSKVQKEEKSKDEQIEVLQARLNALEARVKDEKEDRAEKNLKKAEEKIGKCPACDSFHYYTGKKGDKVVSDKLWACEKFSACRRFSSTDFECQFWQLRSFSVAI